MGDKIVLLVEDNPDDEALTLRALARHGLADRVVVARDGQEALDFLFGEGRYKGRDTSIPPRLILLDLKLPKIDGLQVLERLRAHPSTRRIPVVILTSSGEARDMRRGYDLGANSYVRKPVDFARFIEAARQLGLYWLALNEVPDGGE